MKRLLLASCIALLGTVACNRSPRVWSCEVPAAQSCVQWIEEPEYNRARQQSNCTKFGGLFHDDICPMDDTVFGRCDSGQSSTVYYGRRDVQALRFRCKASGGTWYGSRAQ